ncbi:MAG: ribonuclease Y [Candidatus Brennerbacteria bacterium]|nr:ribonuclease Y [Candidatus Brennerbacteria bacterium]
MTWSPLTATALALAALVAGYAIRLWTAGRAARATADAHAREADAARAEAKEITLSAKSEATSILAEVQREERERKLEIRKLEERIAKREDDLREERKTLDAESTRLKNEETRVRTLEDDAHAAREKAVKALEGFAGLTREEAARKLFAEIEASSRDDLAKAIVKLERERRDALEAKANEVLTSVIQRYARDHVAEITTTAFDLPGEEIKGKIIGKEGRNIRAFERATGVEVIIDETPESLIISSFDPYRRELAKMTLEKLLKDGRIQPAKIEEKTEEARAELDQRVEKIGEDAAADLGIFDFPKEIIALIGRLHFRTSYGQNVLQHSIEMTHLAGMLAAELGADVEIAKRAALVHDIGKAIDHDVEGTHVELGRKLLKKCGVDDRVVKGMEAHHEEYPYATPEAYIVAAADAISAARPGARRDTLEKYVKRLEAIEKTVKEFEGVNQAYAIAAGREVRVFVVPEKIDDFGALELAKKIAGKIQSDVDYPGEIKVTVIREVRAVEYAR